MERRIARSTTSPVARAWTMVKDLNGSQKLELVSIIIDSLKNAEVTSSIQHYTMDEINAMIDQSERDIAEGRVYDFDEAMDELEREFAEEDRELAMAEVL